MKERNTKKKRFKNVQNLMRNKGKDQDYTGVSRIHRVNVCLIFAWNMWRPSTVRWLSLLLFVGVNVTCLLFISSYSNFDGFIVGNDDSICWDLLFIVSVEFNPFIWLANVKFFNRRTLSLEPSKKNEQMVNQHVYQMIDKVIKDKSSEIGYIKANPTASNERRKRK